MCDRISTAQMTTTQLSVFKKLTTRRFFPYFTKRTRLTRTTNCYAILKINYFIYKTKVKISLLLFLVTNNAIAGNTYRPVLIYYILKFNEIVYKSFVFTKGYL